MKKRKPSLVTNDSLGGIGAISKEDIQRIMSEMPAKMEELKRREEEKEQARFTETRTGVCVVCQGKVIGKITRELHDPHHVRFGGHNTTYPKHHGFWCEGCGLKYKFPPPEKK